jgi:hypothetical protein
VGVINYPPERQQNDYEQQMRDYARQHPDSRQARIVEQWDKKENEKNEKTAINA